MAFSEEEIKEFTIEAGDLLDQAEQALLALDKGASLAQHYDAIFRAFHSIKGAAGMMDMIALQDWMHILENLLMEKKTDQSLSRPVTEYFLLGTDAARKLLDGQSPELPTLKTGEEPPTPESTVIPFVAAEEKKIVPAKNGRLIIVDDEITLLEMLRDILQNSGFDVLALDDPMKVMEAIESFHPDAIVSDISMPKMTGLELLNLIYETHPDLPVLFISGHVNKSVLMEAIEHGIYTVIEKPFKSERVIECCLNAVEKHQILRVLNSSINLLMYQFSDLNQFLKSQGKEDIQKVIEQEMHKLIEQKRRFRRIKKQIPA